MLIRLKLGMKIIQHKIQQMLKNKKLIMLQRFNILIQKIPLNQLKNIHINQSLRMTRKNMFLNKKFKLLIIILKSIMMKFQQLKKKIMKRIKLNQPLLLVSQVVKQRNKLLKILLQLKLKSNLNKKLKLLKTN
jgi:hypothetical protein